MISCEEIVNRWSLPEEYLPFACAQDMVGWRRFLEGLITKELVLLLNKTGIRGDQYIGIDKWVSQLIIHLLEITHGIWIYRNLLVHDDTTGILTTQCREHLLEEIEHQLQQGSAGLREEDQWMLEVDLGDFTNSSRERETYWLLAIRTAREHFNISRRETAATREGNT
jgi:hypothetical protein